MNTFQISALAAAMTLFVHVQYLREVWRTWVYQLRYIMLAGCFFQLAGLCGFITYLTLALVQGIRKFSSKTVALSSCDCKNVYIVKLGYNGNEYVSNIWYIEHIFLLWMIEFHLSSVISDGSFGPELSDVFEVYWMLWSQLKIITQDSFRNRIDGRKQIEKNYKLA